MRGARVQKRSDGSRAPRQAPGQDQNPNMSAHQALVAISGDPEASRRAVRLRRLQAPLQPAPAPHLLTLRPTPPEQDPDQLAGLGPDRPADQDPVPDRDLAIVVDALEADRGNIVAGETAHQATVRSDASQGTD